jgi:ornithine decarboxylase
MASDKVKLIFRIWVPDGHSQVPLGEKFGMALRDIPDVVRECHRLTLLSNVIGVSFHCGSGCESVETYTDALVMAQTALSTVDAERHRYDPSAAPCWLLDLGGGFPGIDGLYGDIGRFAGIESTIDTTDQTDATTTTTITTTTTTTVATIARSVRPILHSIKQDRPYITFIAEPGRYFVEGAAVLASRIYRKLTWADGTRVYQIPHGVGGVFKDAVLCNESFLPQPLFCGEGPPPTTAASTETAGEARPSPSPPSSAPPPPLYPSRVIGPSGQVEADDVVCPECYLPDMAVGDWLVFDRMGAYTISIASRTGRPVVKYVVNPRDSIALT